MKLFGIVLVLLAFAVDGAQGAGMRTHVEMVDRALQRHLSQAEQMLPGLSQFLAYPGVVRALYSGSTYPDWGYEGINKDEAEASHWWDYQRRYLKRLQAQCAPPWGDATRKRIAFYIGVLCHGVTDIPWHFSTKRHASFLAMTQRKDKAGHGKTEVSVDLFCHGRNRLKSSMRDWWWPYADLLAGFKPGHSASKGQLQRGRNRQIGLWYAAALLGRAPAAALKPGLRWTLANYQGYYYGGVEHGSAACAMLIRSYYARLRGWRVLQQAPDYGKRSPGCLPYRGVTETLSQDGSRRLRFDLADLPPNRRIQQATLWLYLQRRTRPQSAELRLAGRTIRPGDPAGRWYDWDLSEKTRSWRKHPAGNQGISLSARGGLQFRWSDAFKNRPDGSAGGTGIAYRPLLIIQLEPSR